MHTTTKKIAAARWRKVIAMSAFVAVVIIIIAPGQLEADSWVRRLAAAVGILAGLIIILPWAKSLGLLNVRSYWAYPPSALAIPLGSVAGSAILLAKNMHDVKPMLIVAMTTVIAYCLLSFLLVTRRKELTKKSPMIPMRGAVEPLSLASVITWINADDEIASPRDDLFGVHSEIASRIAGRIIEGRPVSSVLLGARGAGKSSVARMVEAYLHSSDVLCARVSLWPYESVEAAIAGVLEQASEALSSRVEILSLKTVPRRYVNAVSSVAGSGWGGALGIFANPKRPAQIVSGIADRLHSLGLRLCIWIEDLERFEPRSFHVAGEERAGAIYALIHLLDQQAGIQLIVAAERIGTTFDLGKIARFVDRMPNLDIDSLWRVIHFIRRKTELAAPGEIDSAYLLRSDEHARQQSVRSVLDMPEDGMSRLVWSTGLSQGLTTPGAVAELLTTPRLLKSALRRYLEVWSVLRGEIDQDDALLAAIVEVAAPDVLDWAVEHLSLLQGNAAAFAIREAGVNLAQVSDRQRDAARAAREGLDLCIDFLPERGRAAIQALLLELFVGPHGGFLVGGMRKPQGIATTGPRDYFRRYRTGLPVPETEKDQPILEHVLMWKNQRSSQLIAALRDSVSRGPALWFCRDLDAISLTDILEPLAHAILGVDLPPLGEKGPSEIVDLRRLYGLRPIDEERLVVVLGRLLTRYSRRLDYLEFIRNHFIEHSWESGTLLSRESASALRRLIQNLLLEVSREEDIFIQWLSGAGHDYALFYLVWGADRLPGADGVPFDEWSGFADRLISVAIKNPQRICPLVLPFFLSQAHDESDRRIWVFMPQRAQDLFGDGWSSAVTAAEEEPDWSPERVARLRAAKRG